MIRPMTLPAASRPVVDARLWHGIIAAAVIEVLTGGIVGAVFALWWLT